MPGMTRHPCLLTYSAVLCLSVGGGGGCQSASPHPVSANAATRQPSPAAIGLNESLLVAAAEGDVPGVAAILAAHADPNWHGEHGRMPLHEALCSAPAADRTQTVLALIAAGAVPDAEDDYGVTPCEIVAEQLQTGIDAEIVYAMLDARHMTDGRARERLVSPGQRFRAVRDAFIRDADLPAHPAATPYDDDAALRAAYLSAYRDGFRAALREEPSDFATESIDTVAYAGAVYVRLGLAPVEQANELGARRGQRAGVSVANELMRSCQRQWEIDAEHALRTRPDGKRDE